MRRLLPSLLLAFLVVGAQQSALVHEIGHGLGLDPAKTTVAAPRGAASNAGTEEAVVYCQKCFQFAHVAGAVAGRIPAVLLFSVAADPVAPDLVASIAADAPQSRSRGPPFVL